MKSNKDRHNGVYAYGVTHMLHFLTDEGWDELYEGRVEGHWARTSVGNRDLLLPEEYLL